jgi:hypothetical protein
MSRTNRRGRPSRHYRIRVRTERREPIDYAALAQAALEQAATNQADERGRPAESATPKPLDPHLDRFEDTKESRRDRLA